MPNDFDWLLAPLPAAGSGDIDFSGPVTEAKVPVVKDPGQAVMQKRRQRPKALIRAERKLTPIQRFYARMLVETETIAAAERRMADAGYKADRATYYRWRKMPRFVEAVHLNQDYLFDCLGISKQRILTDAEKIKQMALTPQAILHQGKDTGFREFELGTALRALELQGKGVGLQDSAMDRVHVNIDMEFSGRVDGVDVKEGSDIIEGEFEYIEK